jgi:hypothetical protein
MLKFLKTLLKWEKFHEINARYRHGSVKMTPASRAVLFALKIYLFLMIVLLIVKFVMILSGGDL